MILSSGVMGVVGAPKAPEGVLGRKEDELKMVPEGSIEEGTRAGDSEPGSWVCIWSTKIVFEFR